MNIGANLIEQLLCCRATRTFSRQRFSLHQQDIGITEDGNIVTLVASVLVIVIANEELHRTITLSPAIKVITDIKVLPITCRVGGICITQRYILRQNQRIAFAVFGNLGCRQQGGRIIHIDLPSYHTAVALIACKRKEIGKLRSHRHVAASRV